MDKRTVIARARAAAGERDALKQLLLGLLEPTRREPGCLRYELLENAADTDDLMMLEEWESEDAIARHMATPHIQEFLARLGPLLASAPDIRSYRAVRTA